MPHNGYSLVFALIALCVVLIAILVLACWNVAAAQSSGITVLEATEQQMVLYIAPPPVSPVVMVYGARSRLFGGPEAVTVTLFGRCALAVVDEVFVGRRCVWMPSVSQ